MTFDLEKIPAATRHELIVVGRKFGSEDTLEQANRTLKALRSYGAKLALWGFNEEDVKRLEEARDALIAAGVGRDLSRVGKKTTNSASAAAMKAGKSKRLKARSVLTGARRVLAELGDEDAVRAVDTALNHAPTAGDSASKLSAQLDTLQTSLSEGPIAQAVSKRGGPEIVAELAIASASLRATAQEAASPAGTPAETERLDLIDGVIVGLARDARKAARSAAKDAGEAAMATAFELTTLYESTKEKKAAEAPPEPTTAEPAPPPTARTPKKTE